MKRMERSSATFLHLFISLLVASFAAVLVFFIWFPYPYNEVSRGRELFGLIVVVDIILGPLLTFIVFNRDKPKNELWRDLSIIALLQLAALGYGLLTIHNARPIYLVHEVDRFKVVSKIDIDLTELNQAPTQLRKLPWFGVRIIGARTAQSNGEMFSAVESALGGKDISAMPSRWKELDVISYKQIRDRARNIGYLRLRAKDGGVALNKLIADSKTEELDVIGLPLVSRSYDWSVIMNKKDMSIIGYLPIDLF